MTYLETNHDQGISYQGTKKLKIHSLLILPLWKDYIYIYNISIYPQLGSIPSH